MSTGVLLDKYDIGYLYLVGYLLEVLHVGQKAIISITDVKVLYTGMTFIETYSSMSLIISQRDGFIAPKPIITDFSGIYKKVGNIKVYAVVRMLDNLILVFLYDDIDLAFDNFLDGNLDVSYGL